MASPLISLCAIVRDEQELVGRCLGSARGLVDEIVVVDTGSTDATVARATGLGARVVEHRWCDDYAAARNAGLDRARGRWVLTLDADEWIEDPLSGEGDRVAALRDRLRGERSRR